MIEKAAQAEQQSPGQSINLANPQGLRALLSTR
jgi:hypothetical protein